jgi:hypothetical protein
MTESTGMRLSVADIAALEAACHAYAAVLEAKAAKAAKAGKYQLSRAGAQERARHCRALATRLSGQGPSRVDEELPPPLPL